MTTQTHLKQNLLLPFKKSHVSCLLKASLFLWFFWGGVHLLYAQTTTFYFTNGTTNPQSNSITYYDMSTTPGNSSNGLYNDPNQTILDYAAQGAAGTYNYYFIPGIAMASLENSTTPTSTPLGYGWETASPLACDIASGTWTFSNRFEGQIGAGSPNIYVEVYVYVYNETSSSFLFGYTDTTNIESNLSPGSPYTYSFTTSSMGPFTGTMGEYLKVEYYVSMDAPSNYAGGYMYLGDNTSSDYVIVPVCPAPTNTVTNTATSTTVDTATNTATDTSTNTQTQTLTNTNTDTPTGTSTTTQTATSTTVNTATNTATDTSTNTQTQTLTNTNTDTPTGTSTTTQTATSTSIDTATNTATDISTSTETQTLTNTNTDTPVFTNTETNTPTNTVTVTWSSTSTQTAIFTTTLTNTPSFSPTAPPSATPTNSPLDTFTATPNIHTPTVIYPNPYSGNGPLHLQLPLNGKSNVRVTIFSLAFRKIQEADFSNLYSGTDLSFNPVDKNGTELANGLYYVRIESPSGQTILKLLILR